MLMKVVQRGTRWLSSVLFGAATAAMLAVLMAPDWVKLMHGKQPIPRNGYKTWSLFLVTNQDWLVPESREQLVALYQRFEAFGEVIGEEHLAVWFWNRDTSLRNPRLAEAVDVERAVAYCRRLGVPPSRGPYVLFTTEYPDESAVPESFQWIELGGRTAPEISGLLKTLGDQIVLNGIAADGAFKKAPGSEDFWGAWVIATRHALAEMGSGVRFRIRTPFFTIDPSPVSGGPS
jgi:hypothetical protein